ncbi:MAG: deoxyguanosinetriphosphate triphosphohydrolase [Candidatus Pacebacteria bacterium]|nr:deoxyguanosinetriphosphate triphosphohydrolase [Candidatus Paceibacterota bacterium]
MTHNLSANENHLAPYATRSTESRGRRQPHAAHAFRNPFQRDRDRVIHSRAFRRLDGKTQVFLNGKGDHYRTRLTHTIEVAAIARTIARRLRLNEDLTEAIGLAHDLGHTPFGHVGERVLNRLLGERHGGFDHNFQSLRVVDHLEQKYPDIDGLNLTWEVRCGLIKHRGPQTTELDGVILPRHPALEAQVADVADDLAYYTHDIDDGLEAGLLDDSALADVTLWRKAQDIALHEGASIGDGNLAPYTVRCLIDMLVGNVIARSLDRLQQLEPPSPLMAQEQPEPLIGFDEDFQALNSQLKEFLFQHVYWHPEVTQVNERAGRVVGDLFHFFLEHPDQLGCGARARMKRFGLHRSVADYIAGMTDLFALELHGRLC